MVEIVLQGPAKNALSTALLTQIRDGLDTAGEAPLLVRGAGDAFSAGLDLKEVGAFDAQSMERFLRLLEDVVGRLFHHPAPTVAAVNGHAIAGGCIVALVCDHRIATDHAGARLGLNEVALGLRFPPRLLQMVRYRMPPAHHETVLMGASLHSPQRAVALGLVDGLAPSDQVVSTAQGVLDTLSALDRGAYSAAKSTLRGTVGVVGAEVERQFLQDVLPVWTGDALRERIAAFLNRKR